MTLSEFKAWFDGYTENMDGTPDTKQWKRIKKVVKDIDGNTVSWPVYVERYWPAYQPRPYWWTTTGTSLQNQNDTISNCVVTTSDTVKAMYAAGKADAAQEYTI